MNRKMLAILLIAALTLLAAGSAFAALSVHSLAFTEGECARCHNNSPSAKLRGWGLDLSSVPVDRLWYGQKIAPLCWTCHRSGNTMGASAMENLAFADAGHSFAFTDAPNTPNTYLVPAQEDYTATGLPYVLVGGVQSDIDCTTCHNVHNNDRIPFSMIGNGTDFSTLCTTCHAGRVGGANVGAANTGAMGGLSTHPTDLAYANLAGNGPTNLLAPPDARVSRTSSVAAYALGGKRTDFTAGGNMSCQTCHSIHGDTAIPNTFYEDLVAIINVNTHAGAASSTLCTGCHGNPYQAGLTTVGSGTDHPIDGNGGWAFYPSGFATASGIPGAWIGAAHGDSGATTFNPATQQNVACSSCHDAHGGIAATSMLYGPNAAVVPDTNWCFSCHPSSTVLPPYHHSVADNYAASLLQCGDCHGTGGAGSNWSAHNGFYSFRWALSATDSNFCEGCHTAADPTTLIGYGAGTYPATKGSYAGPSSHSVDVATCITSNFVKYAGNWAGLANGPYDVIARGVGVISEWGGAGEVRCESCHNILENVGNRVAPANTLTGGYQANLLLLSYEDDDPGTAAGDSHDYLPNGANGTTGDELCRVCHNLNGAGAGGYVHYPAAHTEGAGFTYAAGEEPYGRTTNTILTGGACNEATTADAAGAPGVFSYPVANEVNCDTCHRPHDSYTTTAANGAGTSGYVILESDLTIQVPANRPKTGACALCHDVNVMCGY